MRFAFRCRSCGEVHQGMPALDAAAPLSDYAVPEDEREMRCQFDSDACIIDESQYFIRGCLEVPVHGEPDPFSWGVWASLSEQGFREWVACCESGKRAHIGPFVRWLNTAFKPYPDTANLKTHVNLRHDVIRPSVALESTDHPLAVEQREGISIERIAELYALVVQDAHAPEESTDAEN